MSASSAQRTYRSRRSRYTPDYRLDQLFSDDELSVKLMIARYRILMAFDHATYWSHGKLRGTDNFIIGVGPRQGDLADYVFNVVVDKMKCGIVTASELPEFVGNMTGTLRRVAEAAEQRLIAVQLAMMAPDEVWFNAATPGTWNVAQSLMDEYRLSRELVRSAKKIDAQLRREALHNGERLRVVH
jgi:hypothetical protein